MVTQLRSTIAHAGEGGPKLITPTSPHIKRLLGEMEAKGFQFLSVPRKDGEFLHLMVKALRSKNVLEIGTSQGFSALWMGLALEETNGNLITIEIDKALTTLARKHLNEAGLSHRVTCITGDAHVEVTKLEGPFDFIFLDADKEGVMDYFNKIYPKKLLPGGLMVVHNAIQYARSMKDYLEMIQKHPDFDTIILSVTMEDGFCLSYRHRRI
ncbi:MAG: O-methyltransferase [Thermodesulfobacteriota bacterium]